MSGFGSKKSFEEEWEQIEKEHNALRRKTNYHVCFLVNKHAGSRGHRIGYWKARSRAGLPTRMVSISSSSKPTRLMKGTTLR